MVLIDVGTTLLIILFSLLGLWLLLLLVDLIFVASFSSIFRKHKKAVPVILFTKLESLNNMISIMKQCGVDVDNRLVALLKDINQNDLLEPGSPQFEKGKNSLSYLRDEIFFVANQHPELKNDFEFTLTKKNIDDCDIQYRSTVAMYNADVLGYNYWTSFLPCRFIFKIFRVKKKEIIS